MKTIKFLHDVKYTVLLILAFFGILIGGAQSTPRTLTTADISSGKNATRPAPVLELADIGEQRSLRNADMAVGGQTAPRSGGTRYDIGGNQNPPRCLVSVTDLEIGGQTTPRNGLLPKGFKSGVTNCTFYHKEIGGQNAPRTFTDIGGNQTPPRQLEIAENCFAFTPLLSTYEFVENISGNSVPRTCSLDDGIPEIGGGQWTPRP